MDLILELIAAASWINSLKPWPYSIIKFPEGGNIFVEMINTQRFELNCLFNMILSGIYQKAYLFLRNQKQIFQSIFKSEDLSVCDISLRLTVS